MPKKSAEKMIDDLAIIVKKAFDRVDARFDEVSTKKDLDELETGLNTRLDRIEYLVSGHDRRIDIVEDRIRQIATKIGISFQQ